MTQMTRRAPLLQYATEFFVVQDTDLMSREPKLYPVQVELGVGFMTCLEVAKISDN